MVKGFSLLNNSSTVAVCASHGGLQPSPGPWHPLRGRWHGFQEGQPAGDSGPDRCPLVAGEETAMQLNMCWTHPLGLLAQEVLIILNNLYKYSKY